MFAAFRRLSKSTLGTVVTVLFLLAIAASFALADLSNVGSGTIGGGGAGTLAKVGNQQISDREMSENKHGFLVLFKAGGSDIHQPPGEPGLMR